MHVSVATRTEGGREHKNLKRSPLKDPGKPESAQNWAAETHLDSLELVPGRLPRPDSTGVLDEPRRLGAGAGFDASDEAGPVLLY
jgi:hypothetical protein